MIYHDIPWYTHDIPMIPIIRLPPWILWDPFGIWSFQSWRFLSRLYKAKPTLQPGGDPSLSWSWSSMDWFGKLSLWININWASNVKDSANLKAYRRVHSCWGSSQTSQGTPQAQAQRTRTESAVLVLVVSLGMSACGASTGNSSSSGRWSGLQGFDRCGKIK